MADEPIQPIDINSDENADWIKLVHDGKSQKEELAIHRELDKENKKNMADRADGALD